MGIRRRRRRLDPKERGRDVSFGGIRESEEPSPGPRDTVEDEVSQAVTFSGRGIEKVLANPSFNLGRQALLRRSVGGTVDVGVGEEGRSERRLSVRAQKTAVNVIFVEARPNACSKLLGQSQARNISGRSVFGCAAAPRPPAATPRLASLQSSSESGLPTRRPRE